MMIDITSQPMNEYEVPVWFRISAKNLDEAWWKIRQVMVDCEQHEQLPEYVIEEPVPLPTEDFHAS